MGGYLGIKNLREETAAHWWIGYSVFTVCKPAEKLATHRFHLGNAYKVSMVRDESEMPSEELLLCHLLAQKNDFRNKAHGRNLDDSVKSAKTNLPPVDGISGKLRYPPQLPKILQQNMDWLI